MKQVLLKDVKKGDLFIRKPAETPTAKQVYIKGDYIRSDKKYNCVKWCDCLSNGVELKGNTKVFIDFIF